MTSKLQAWDTFYQTLSAGYWDELDPEAQTNLEGQPVPEDIRRAACMIHPHPVGWFDNPIPNFEGRTPRQVLERRGGGDKVRAILMEVAPHFLPDLGSGTSVLGRDTSALRQKP
jgi:hypothetical protein